MITSRSRTVRTTSRRSPWSFGRLVVAGATLVALAVFAGFSSTVSTARGALPGINGKIACDGERGFAPGLPAGGFPRYVTPRNEVYTMNPDGSGFRLLTSNDVADIDPTYNADGSKIAFSSARQSSFVALHTMNADGSNVRRVLFTGAQSTQPSWSPDGANIVYMDGSRRPFDISRVNVNTGVVTPLTNHPSVDGLPSWSPDGTQIVFDSLRTPPFNVWTMSAAAGEASGLTKLTSPNPTDPFDNSYSPQWSPDGTRITFLTDRDGNAEVYSMRADGSDLRRLTSTVADDPASPIDESEELDPAYSADGTRIVFSSARSGDFEVYTMHAASGGDVRRLTNSPGFDGRCEWQPVRPAASASPPAQPVNPQPAASFAGCRPATANVIRGTEAANTLTGTPAGDRIFAGTGDDRVDALAGDDCVDLGPGGDRGQGGLGADLMLGGLGGDRIGGSAGDDRLLGGSAADRLAGGPGNDSLHGQSGGDVISGERGRDRINGGSSGDTISAGSSGDRVAGDQGGDRISGNSGNDLLKGNSGNDRLKGSGGRDRLAGGSGNDRLDARDGQRDRVACGRGRDNVIADSRDRVSRDCERVSRRG